MLSKMLVLVSSLTKSALVEKGEHVFSQLIPSQPMTDFAKIVREL